MNIPPLSKEGILVLVAWTLIWKGFALWKSARRGDKYWYLAMLVISTLGILEYLYIFVFSERGKKKVKSAVEPEKLPKKTTKTTKK